MSSSSSSLIVYTSIYILFNNLFQKAIPTQADSCLCLLPRLPFMYTLPSSFYSITCFRRQFTTQACSCLCLIPRLSARSTLPSTFYIVPCFRRLFQRKLWPILLPFLLFIVQS